MSFFARKSKTDPIENAISADKIMTPAERERDYYCPGCSCVFRYRAASSNERAAHFFRHGTHDPNCWMPLADSINGQIDMNLPKGFSLEHLYFSVTHSKNRSGKGVGTAGGGTKAVTQIKLNTLRNLYKFCCYHDNNYAVGDGLKVKDIFVGKKTSYLYTKYVKGIHLVECQCHYYKRETQSIFFQYPFGKSPALKIQIHFNDESIFCLKVKQLFRQKAPVLIFADWEMRGSYVYAEIFTTRQIVPLSNRCV